MTARSGGGLARARTVTRSWALTETVTDAEDRITTRRFDVRGNLLSVTDPLGQAAADGSTGDSARHTVTYTYDLRDRVTSIVDGGIEAGKTNTISNQYDNASISQSDVPVGMVDPDLGTVAYEYDSNNRLVAQTDARQNRLETLYDTASRPVTVTRDGTTVSEWTYDTVKVGLPASSTHHNVFVDPDTGAVSQRGEVTKTFTFDDRLRPTSTTWTVDAPSLLPQTYTGTVGSTHRESGSVDTMSFPNGSTTTYGYDLVEQVNRIDHTNTDNVAAVYATHYNARGQLAWLGRGTSHPDSTDPALGALNTATVFEDWSGRALSMVSDRGVDIPDPVPDLDRGVVPRLYRAFLGREPDTGGLDYWTAEAQMTPPPGAPADNEQARVGFFFLLADETQTYIAGLTNPATGQPWDTEQVGSETLLTAESLVDLTIQLMDGNPTVSQATRDAYVAAINNASPTIPVAPGELSERNYQRGRVVWELLDSVQLGQGGLSPAVAQPEVPEEQLQALEFTYSTVGNIQQIRDTGDGFAQSQCFGYDDLNRLTTAYTTGDTTCSGYQAQPEEFRPFDIAYTYDPTGNITNATGQGTVNGAYVYGTDRPHAVTQAGDNVYSYDESGNMVVWPGQQLGFDVNNRLVTIFDTVNDTRQMDALYDAEGNRVVRQLTVTGMGPDSGETTTTVYLAGYEQDVESGETRVPHMLAGRMVGITINGELNLTATDHLGSGSVATDRDGTTATVQRYTPFGFNRTGGNTLGFDQTFTGQTDDPGTGLIDYNARHYDPQLARFIMADTVLDGLNRYTYVRNNPMRFVDPTGNCTVISGDLICGRNGKNFGSVFDSAVDQDDSVGSGSAPGLPLTISQGGSVNPSFLLSELDGVVYATNTSTGVTDWLFSFAKGGKQNITETYTPAEIQAAELRRAGKPYDRAAWNRFRAKEKRNEKAAGDRRNSQNKDSPINSLDYLSDQNLSTEPYSVNRPLFRAYVDPLPDVGTGPLFTSLEVEVHHPGDAAYLAVVAVGAAFLLAADLVLGGA